jgi:uncharacterized protein YcsI (UPF0317 family)
MNEAADLRLRCRAGEHTGPTAGLAPGFAQANLVVLPGSLADDFRLFCERNPKPCPLLESTAPGSPTPEQLAPSADLRTDLPRYRVYRAGELADDPTDITPLWREDFVAFLLGCSFTFEAALTRAGFEVRHLAEGRNVPMYRTDIACEPAGVLAGPMVVSMRPFPAADVAAVSELTARFDLSHGAPVHAGDPRDIGIDDLSRPDYGEAVTVRTGEVPVFWACGVTPQAVAVASRPQIMITHAPGCMFITDRRE